MKVLETRQLKKSFVSGNVKTQAVDGADLAVKPGEFVAIMGPSGSGKSTLLNLIGLLEKPDSGEVLYRGTDLARASEKQRTAFRRDNIGFIFQGFNLIDELSAQENVELPLKYRGFPAEKRHQLAKKALESVGIAHRAGHYPSTLSGGQQQRVAIARAIAGEPEVILADEPTGNLDSKTGLEVMELLADLNQQGATIIMVTHSQRDSGFASRIIAMQDGHILSDEAVSGPMPPMTHDHPTPEISP